MGRLTLKSNHRLLCGDCTNAEHVAEVLAGGTPFMMVTDPPYGVNYDPAWRNEVKFVPNRRLGEVSNDDRADWTPAFALFGGDIAYVWHSGLHAHTVEDSLIDNDFELRGQIIWNKDALVFGRGHYHWKHEPCWYAVRKGKQANWAGDRTQSTVWDIPNMRTHANNVKEGETPHSTQKPIECMARAIRNHGEAGDAIYDPFLGSGAVRPQMLRPGDRACLRRCDRHPLGEANQPGADP